jgi:hypothetical protein
MVFLVFWIGAAGLGLVEKVRGVGVSSSMVRLGRSCMMLENLSHEDKYKTRYFLIFYFLFVEVAVCLSARVAFQGCRSPLN